MSLTTRFDPHEWNRVYDDADGPAQHHVFRRSAAVAEAACHAVMHSGDRWLDLGSGTGQLSRALRAGGALVTSVDHDVAMLQFAGDGLAARAEQLPVADASMHGVVAVSLLGCLEESLSTFREAYRVLRSNGHLVFTCTNAESLLLSLNAIAARPSAQQFRLYRANSVRTELLITGFHVVALRYYNTVLHIGRRLFPPPFVAQRLDNWGMERIARNFIVVATKP